MPNGLTWMRILLAPVIAAFLVVDLTGFAFALFLVAVLSDFMDGALARGWNTGSAFGAALDPIADKVLVITVLCAIAARGHFDALDLIALGVIALREIGITVLRHLLSASGDALPVSLAGKMKTFVQMLAAGLYLFSLAPAGVAAETLLPIACFAKAALWAGAALAVLSGLDYAAAALSKRKP